jgi:hypothetical protein
MFFAEQEAFDLDENAKITPVRQEQLKDRLGDAFHELDTPLLVEWPDGSRAAALFVAEEETSSLYTSLKGVAFLASPEKKARRPLDFFANILYPTFKHSNRGVLRN